MNLLLVAKPLSTGSRNLEEAHNLAVLLRSGALPVKVDIIETRTVGPTLGQDSKDKSIFAFAVGVGAIFVFMLLFYRASGLIADLSLMAYVVILLFVLKLLDATLTLPGVAGIILSIGMAVDANVLIFEHFKEEVRNGKTLRMAMDSGFKRAFTTIFDSNLTTIIAAAVLFLLRHRSNPWFCHYFRTGGYNQYVYQQSHSHSSCSTHLIAAKLFTNP